jgi:hypothetical protein
MRSVLQETHPMRAESALPCSVQLITYYTKYCVLPCRAVKCSVVLICCYILQQLIVPILFVRFSVICTLVILSYCEIMQSSVRLSVGNQSAETIIEKQKERRTVRMNYLRCRILSIAVKNGDRIRNRRKLEGSYIGYRVV